jgi:ABC-type multidrug transport system fused ATPase/permease subunit
MATSGWRRDGVRFCQNYLVYFLPITFLVYLILESYQIDFRSFYLGGKSVLLGLDPYLNYVGVRPEFYGPVNSELAPFSGFRYPPLAALVFAPIASLPYQTAKALFTLAMIATLGLLSFHMVRQSRFTLPGEAILFMMVSFPVLTLTERGQVDSFVLYLTALSYWLMGEFPEPGDSRTRRRYRPLAAFLLAFSGIFKVFPLVVLFFYSARRQWRFVSYTILWAVALFALPYAFFGQEVYHNFFRRTFPAYFGEIPPTLPLDLHGQGIILNKIVQSVDAIDLVVTHDFVNGFMNPLLSSSTVGSVISGLILSAILLVVMRRCPVDFQFYAFLNVINLFNPVAWIMGLVWYVPMFLYLSPRVTRLGQFLSLLPLFMPPFLNTNAIWAYVLSILFALAFRLPRLHRGLFLPTAAATEEAVAIKG